MAASTLTLSAELKFRDGRAHKVDKINVAVENTLTSLIAGIHKMGENVSQLLNELVDKERLAGDFAADDEDDCEDEDSDDDEAENQSKSELQPPAKRHKT
ncbi:uncharacterized protein si:dkeyp-55f12.3 [Hippocampus zosterae]|uniref:uncharacterized protein si:dkeyp-55f12.3 n=1 Tax=Hippocampus zosterae TaxID=109293 RepID=UPI00223DC8C2|nr:uncharacterized protein si:dkeyp-55f12.3 [Hippocampus zosterae]